ncbi:MAG: choice-of-anchor Q domain-containing protein [bacterium]|nr:choice-of-anchor Q domain-containing protein [bacterium]
MGGYWFAWPQRDADGNCRLVGLAVDMGCYEYGSSPDADGDLLSDADEWAAATDPLTDDSDGDGLRDGLELLRGSNALQVTAPGILNVPSDFATIQQSLCVSLAGDEIIVSPGAYPGNLQFCGPDIILRSSDPGDPNVVGSTVIDGGGLGPVVSFMGGESQACVLAGFTIRNGHSVWGGGILGGTYSDHTRAIIENNTITGNSAGYGGGLCACNGTIQNNTITGNSAGYSGGGLASCYGTIQNNTITGNAAKWYGGGLSRCNGTIRNNTIAGNSAEWSGGGLTFCGGTAQNNTITGNSAEYDGGGLYECDGTVRNCILWGNTAPSGPQLQYSSIPTYSCIEGWTGDSEKRNISAEPRFAGPDTGDFRLLPSSPCIDAGYNHPSLPPTDIVGMRSIMFGGKSLTVDTGAWEYYVNALSRELGGNAVLTWSSLTGKSYRVERSSDMLTWQTAAETVPSLGDTTTTWTDTTAPFLSPGVQIRYYRTVER